VIFLKQINKNKWGWNLGRGLYPSQEKQVKHNYNKTKINQFAHHEELLP